MLAGLETPSDGEIAAARRSVINDAAAEPAADLPRVPVAGAVPAPHGRREHRLPAQDEGRRRRAGREARARELMRDDAAARGLLRAERHALLGRRAAARGAGARLRLRPGDPVLRRAALGARLQAEEGAREGAQGHPQGDRQDLHLHHPQPRGGDGDVGPDRGDARRPHRPDRHARGDLHPPGQPLRRRVHGRGERLPGAPQRRRRSTRASTSPGTFRVAGTAAPDGLHRGAAGVPAPARAAAATPRTSSTARLYNSYSLGSRMQYRVRVGEKVLVVEQSRAARPGTPAIDSGVVVGWDSRDAIFVES